MNINVQNLLRQNLLNYCIVLVDLRFFFTFHLFRFFSNSPHPNALDFVSVHVNLQGIFQCFEEECWLPEPSAAESPLSSSVSAGLPLSLKNVASFVKTLSLFYMNNHNKSLHHWAWAPCCGSWMYILIWMKNLDPNPCFQGFCGENVLSFFVKLAMKHEQNKFWDRCGFCVMGSFSFSCPTWSIVDRFLNFSRL